jgi:hypothetical protein
MPGDIAGQVGLLRDDRNAEGEPYTDLHVAGPLEIGSSPLKNVRGGFLRRKED